jgi:soluble lytic murein transglycosylase
MAESDNQLSLAMANYHAVAHRDSVLRPYALKHMSQIARSTGNLMLERIYLSEILLFSPDSLVANAALPRLARNGFEIGNYGETIRLLTSGKRSVSTGSITRSANDAGEREIQTLLAEACLRSGQEERARDIFTNLLNKMPNPAQPDDAALTAAKGLDHLDGGSENFGRKAPDLNESEHLWRANIYQSNRDFADAKLHFEAIIANNPTGANMADALFQIGRGYAQQSEYAESFKWFERILEQYPNSVAAKDALLQAAASYARVGKGKEAITRYQNFINKYPADEKLDRAFLNIVDILRDQGADTDALKWCAKTQAAFKGKVPEAVALFTQTRIFIAKEDWPAALDTLERLNAFPDLGGVAVPGGTNAAEITFLKAFVLEQMKRYAEAIDTYLSIIDGRGEYYGWRATKRLRLLENNETARSFIDQKTGALATGLKSKDAEARRKNAQALLRVTDSTELSERAIGVLKAAIKISPKYQLTAGFKLRDLKVPSKSIAGQLLSLGLFDEAAPELEASMPDMFKAVDDKAFALATYYKSGDRAGRGLALIEPHWRKVPADYPIELIPRDQAEMLYPAPYADVLLKFAPERGVDPRLVLSIMRQESRFQPEAKSYAAARGLMQFISTTSIRVAGELGRNNFHRDDLYFPPTAILFGSQYLGDLFRGFPNQPDAVVASYNGGEDNMKRWLSRSRSNLPDRYVPEIVYSQTKDYVYKVMANYRMYQYLYDEQLRPRQ